MFISHTHTQSERRPRPNGASPIGGRGGAVLKAAHGAHLRDGMRLSVPGCNRIASGPVLSETLQCRHGKPQAVTGSTAHMVLSGLELPVDKKKKKKLLGPKGMSRQNQAGGHTFSSSHTHTDILHTRILKHSRLFLLLCSCQHSVTNRRTHVDSLRD